MSPSVVDPAQSPLNSFGAVWGPPLIATFIAAIVYGISVLQTFYYYSHHGKRDGLGWLILVAVIFVLDSTAMGLFMYCVYYYAILSWGMPEMLVPDVKEFPSEYIITTLLALIVQNFYINTIRALRAPITVTVLLVLTSITAFIAGLILPGVQLKLVSIPVIVVAPLNHLAFNIARGTALACDVGIVIVLCWLFAIRKTGVRRANNVLDALIMFSVQRGVLQAIVQLGEVLAYAIEPSGLYFLPFHVIVSRIYCNSLLATLNSRDYVLSKGLSSHERVRRRQLDDGDIEMENARIRNAGHIVERDSKREHERSSAPAAPPGLAVTLPAISEESAGRWASSLSASQPILSSFLEPPFLFSASHTSDSNARSFSISTTGRALSTSNVTFSSVNASTRASSGRDMETAQSMGSGTRSEASDSPVTPVKINENGEFQLASI